jgi:hypothetical protein
MNAHDWLWLEMFVRVFGPVVLLAIAVNLFV